MIEVSQLTKRYAHVAAVTDVTFCARSGEIVGLLGPNGAGKTSTLHSIVGIVTPDAGSVRVCGIDLIADPKHAKRHLAFVADEPEFFEYLTVKEHLRFTGMLYGGRDSADEISATLAKFDLGDKAEAYPAQLSRGMRQKLALACALSHNPSVLLLDEPLTGLDPAGMRQMKDIIIARARSGAAVILSSHMLSLVQELCTRLVILNHGRLVASGTLDEVRGISGMGPAGEIEDVFLSITGSEGGTAT